MEKFNGENIKMLSVIILAAGESKRMGKTKQILPFGSGTILEHVINNLMRSKIDEIILVLGYRAEEIMSMISNKPSKTVINPSYKWGMSSSIICGLNVMDKNSEAAMIVLGDQPLIEKEIIDELVKAYSESDRGIIVPVYKKMRGNPVIFDMKYRDKLLALTGDIGGRGIIEAHQEDVLEVEINSEAVIIDIDERGDYLKQLEKTRH